MQALHQKLSGIRIGHMTLGEICTGAFELYGFHNETATSMTFHTLYYHDLIVCACVVCGM